VALIIATFAVILLGLIGLTWAESTSLRETPSLSEEQNIVQMNPAETRDRYPDGIRSTSAATAVAPSVPTAIATSKADPTIMPLPIFSNPLDGGLVAEADSWGAEFVLLNEENTGVWQYAADSFVQPVALEVGNGEAYLLDGGRVLMLDLAIPQPPKLLLSPGEEIGGVLVLEPLDLALVDDALYVLDRAGDVYRYDLASGVWELDRYDRPVEESSGHYFVAVDVAHERSDEAEEDQSRTLLETNYKFAMNYGGVQTSLWNLPEGRSVDVSSVGDDVFVLQREMFDLEGRVTKYQDTRLINTFAPVTEIQQPRQLVATETAVYVLDREGVRLLALDPQSGILLRVYQ
jgi:hypothetical protein